MMIDSVTSTIPDNSIIQKYAQEYLERTAQVFEMILPTFDDTLKEVVLKEKAEVMERARSLDVSLDDLINRCAEAKTSEVLVAEMRQLRIQGLHFFIFLRTSRRLLRVVSRRAYAQARITGLNSEARMLKTESLMADADQTLREAQGLVGIPPKQFSRLDELLLFFGTLTLPFRSWIREKFSRKPSRSLAKSKQQFIRLCMRKIYKEQLLSLGVVVWLVVQPAIILSLVGVGLTYLIHVILELAGIHALEPTLLALLAITATYFLHKLAEHIFENWHLRRYRKKCTETGMRLFLVEVRARANLVGLVALSEAQSKTS